MILIKYWQYIIGFFLTRDDMEKSLEFISYLYFMSDYFNSKL